MTTRVENAHAGRERSLHSNSEIVRSDEDAIESHRGWSSHASFETDHAKFASFYADAGSAMISLMAEDEIAERKGLWQYLRDANDHAMLARRRTSNSAIGFSADSASE